jgi:MFS family permease
LAATTAGIVVSTNLAGRSIAKTGRYRVFPLAGLAVMAVALALLAVVAGHPDRTTTALCIALFGLGFGMVGQVLIVAVQNGVDRGELGTAMAATSFFRALGGAVGAAVFGAVFAARADTPAGIPAGIQAVFVVAAPLALVAFAVVLALKEVPLRGSGAAG